MKRFLVFASTDYQATEQGWDGFQGDFDTLDEAIAKVQKITHDYDLYQIVDTTDKKIIQRDRFKSRIVTDA